MFVVVSVYIYVDFTAKFPWGLGHAGKCSCCGGIQVYSSKHRLYTVYIYVYNIYNIYIICCLHGKARYYFLTHVFQLNKLLAGRT